MPLDRSTLARPRNIVLAIFFLFVLGVGAFAYSVANTAGMLPWQEDPTPIANAITPFAGTGLDLPTTPPKRTPTPEPTSATTPAASPSA